MTDINEEITEGSATTVNPKEVVMSHSETEPRSPQSVPAKPSPPKPLGSPNTGKLAALPLPKPLGSQPSPLQKPGSSPSGAFSKVPSPGTGSFPKVASSSSSSLAVAQPPKPSSALPKPLPAKPASSGSLAKVSLGDSAAKPTPVSPSGAFTKVPESSVPASGAFAKVSSSGASSMTSGSASGAFAKVPPQEAKLPAATDAAARLPSPLTSRNPALSKPVSSASGAFLKAPAEARPASPSSSFAKAPEREAPAEVPNLAAVREGDARPGPAEAAPEVKEPTPSKPPNNEEALSQKQNAPAPATDFRTITPPKSELQAPSKKEKDDGFVQLDIASLLLDGNEPSEEELLAPKRKSAPLSTSAVLAGVPQVIPEGLILDSRYRLLKLLGEGGMGAVYKAEHLLMRKPVAIKILKKEAAVDRDLVMRFIREAQLASRLSNPHCVTIHDFGQTSDRDLYLVMELIEGDVLRDLMIEQGKLSIERAYRIMVQLLDALGAAHDIGVIHRDVKPENIMLVKDPGRESSIAKLLDFGIARPSSPVATGVTRSGFTVGTPGYIAPEQALGKTLDGRTDLYAAAVIFYEMICGRRPYLGNSAMEIITNQVSQPPPRPSQVAPEAKIPIAIEDVLLRALSKDPDKRYPNAKEFRLALEKSLEKSGRSTQTQGEPAAPAAPAVVQHEEKVSDDELLRVAGHRRAPAIVAGLLFGVLLGGGGVLGYSAYFKGSSEKPRNPDVSVPATLADPTPHFNPKEARELYEKGDLIGAVSALAALPKRDRNTPETQILSAMVSSQLNNWNNARASIRMVRHFGTFPAELVPTLLRNASAAQSTRDAALARAAVAELGVEALKEISSMLRSPDENTRRMAYTFLLEIDEAEAPLVENVRKNLEGLTSCAERQSLLRSLQAVNSPGAADDLLILVEENKLFCVKNSFEQ